MSRAWAALSTLALAAILMTAAWNFWGDNQTTETAEEIPTKECDSCSARHKNLTRLRDAKSLTELPGE